MFAAEEKTVYVPLADLVDDSGNDPAAVGDYAWTVEDDGIYEAIPMGIFEVSEANRTVKCLELKAYDYMLRLEKDFNGFEIVGKAYDFIHLCCAACQVVVKDADKTMKITYTLTEEE